MIKIIHTADWHIGQMLHGFERGNEHREFLRFLLETMKSEEADALVVCGDIFDSSNPSAESQKLAYDFLSELRAEMPHADIILTGGNHDSWSRLDAPGALFRSIGVTMIGRLRTKPDGSTDAAAMAVPIHDRNGDVALYAAAVPFIRVADIGCGTEDLTQDLVVSRIGGIYRDVLDYIRTLPSKTGKALALGHCYMVNGLLSELSERKVLCGNQHALPVSVFDGYDFAALGHLHRDQAVAPNVVYSGSPLALSMDEGRPPYHHRLVELVCDGDGIRIDHSIEVPQPVKMYKVPAKNELKGVVEESLRKLAAELPFEPDIEKRPFLEVPVLITTPEPGLESFIAGIVRGRVRLVRIVTGREQAGITGGAAGGAPEQLEQISEEEVLRRKWAYDGYTGTVPDDIMKLYHASVEKAREQLGEEEGGRS